MLGDNVNKEKFIEKTKEIVEYIGDLNFMIQEEAVSVQLKSSISFEEDKSSLFSSADMAMKSAKKNRQSLLIYDQNLDLSTVYENNIKWTKKLQDAIRNNRILPYFQPIVDNRSGKCSKYEALVRLIDEEGNVISPYFFLEIAKRTQYYEILTKIVIKKSFDVFKNLESECSINLTIKDILDQETQKYIFSMLEEYKIGHRVVFEIVESEGIENYDLIIEFINNVKNYGCKISIDDFGSGYSNFEYLLRLKADFIKIDGSLIKNLKTDYSSRVMVSTIVSFAQQLGISTVAEFVSDPELLAIVTEMGIDFSQGYYLGEPKSDPIS